jgi:hypothetical protein
MDYTKTTACRCALYSVHILIPWSLFILSADIPAEASKKLEETTHHRETV